MVLKPGLIFSWCYLHCQVLGLNFSDGSGSWFWKIFPHQPPSAPRHTAHRWRGRLSLGAPARFLSGAPRESRRVRGPYLPGHASCLLGGSARANTMNKVGWPGPGSSAGFPQHRREGSPGKPQLLFQRDQKKKEERKHSSKHGHLSDFRSAFCKSKTKALRQRGLSPGLWGELVSRPPLSGLCEVGLS